MSQGRHPGTENALHGCNVLLHRLLPLVVRIEALPLLAISFIKVV